MPPRFEDVYAGKPGLYYEIHPDSILACDASKFLETFNVERIAAAGKLRHLRGHVHLGIRGWDNDPRALHEIPEVRRYVQHLDRQFPFLAYIATTKNETLRIMSLCVAPTSITQRTAGAPETFLTTFDTQAYHEVLQRWFRSFDMACELSRGFTHLERADMTIELAKYFGLEWYYK